jgi:hypothetical protein
MKKILIDDYNLDLKKDAVVATCAHNVSSKIKAVGHPDNEALKNERKPRFRRQGPTWFGRLSSKIGEQPFARHVDLPPYSADFNLRLQIIQWVTTSFGIVRHNLLSSSIILASQSKLEKALASPLLHCAAICNRGPGC